MIEATRNIDFGNYLNAFSLSLSDLCVRARYHISMKFITDASLEYNVCMNDIFFAETIARGKSKVRSKMTFALVLLFRFIGQDSLDVFHSRRSLAREEEERERQTNDTVNFRVFIASTRRDVKNRESW